MKFNTEKDLLRSYESPACFCHDLRAQNCFLVGSPFGVTDPENFEAPVSDDDNWM